MLPSIDSIRCFVEAARFLNFRAAARAVSLTPAALGKRIQQLEDQLGTSLFHRTTRRVELTEAGLALLPRARALLDAAEACVRAGRGETGPPEMALMVGTRHELGLSWLVPILPALRAALPHITFHLYFSSGPDLEMRVHTQEIDCAVTSRHVTDPRIDMIRLHSEDYALVGQPALLARQPLERDEDAAAHTLIDAHADLPLFRYWRDAPEGGDRLRFGRVLCMGTIAAIRALVLSGEGVGVLPRYLVAGDLSSGALEELFVGVKPLTDHFRLIFRADDPRRSVFVALAGQMLAEPLR